VCILTFRSLGKDEEGATKPWVDTALEDSRVNTAAVKTIVKARYGTDAVTYDMTDVGSNKEATATGRKVIHGGAFSKEAWANIKKAKECDDGFMPAAGKVCPTNLDVDLTKTVPAEAYTTDTQRFVDLIKRVSPHLLDHEVTVRVMNDRGSRIGGCTQWEKASYVFTINLAHHDVSDRVSNYGLLIHELSHHAVQSNDHLCSAFHGATTGIGARLGQLALNEPELFEGTGTEIAPISAEESEELQAVAMAQK
jgi:hypothetical protein